MVTESALMSEGLERELGLLLRDQQWQEPGDRERDIYRSGSAPPTVEGSLAAVGGMFGAEEELRSDPAYQAYYYSHVNLNPRLPPPALSKEDWRFSQRLGGIGDKRRGGGSNSLFSLQPGFREEPEVDEWGGGGLIGLPELQLSRSDMFQDDLGRATPVSGHPSRPASRNAFVNGIENLNLDDPRFTLHHDNGYLDGMQHGGNAQSVAGFQNNAVSPPETFASVVGKSLSRSNTPDPKLLSRAPSPCLPPVGVRLNNNDKKTNGSCPIIGVSSGTVNSNEIVTPFSGMSLKVTGGIEKDSVAHSKLHQEIDGHQKFLFGSQGSQDYKNQLPSFNISNSEQLNMSSVPHFVKSSYADLSRKNSSTLNSNSTSGRPNGHVDKMKPTISSPNTHLRAPSSFSVTSPIGSPAHNTDVDGASAAFASYGLNGYSVNPALSSMMSAQVGTNNLPPLFENAAAAAIGSHGLDSRAMGGFSAGSNLSGISDLHHLSRIGNNTAAAALQYPLVDPLYIQYLRTAEYAAQIAANFGDPSMDRSYLGNSYADLLGMQNANLGALLQPQKQYGMPFVGKTGGLNNGYYGNPAFGFGMSYPGSPVLPGSPVGPGSPLRHGERNLHIPSGLRNIPGGVMGSWHSDPSGNLDGSFPSSLLEEFKSNKTKCYELSDIASHVVEFSADQYGSRFIQQKLESATTEEKNMVFEEIMPQAFSLITDVFGNYVIQKFFEHGSASQRRELADQLTGHVLTLSLQMYGCRVIQKAIEVVDLDQQIKMVAELDGNVMRCVRDQNGNHVIQKCIECVPQNEIQFIISSFYDQVVTLSTHPYGCRVIQRVLEHCDDPKTQQIMMDEIMKSVCMLAQDQYGNYVIQHVLEHGKPHERSDIIKKLAGLIVQMSQQKFASNVVEKCLTFGGPDERRFLVNEMLGSTEENEPLQAMMKDQFANYVVQKVLETCDELQREHILARIKVHLNALKKYTYGKHIVARVEKLVAAGERRMGVPSSCAA